MKGPRRIGLRLLALAPILLALVLLAPLGAQASGELVIKEYISKDVVQVGEMVTFGQGEPPVAGMVVRWNFGDGSPEVTGWPVTHTYTKAGNYTITAVVTYPTTGTTTQATPATIRVVATGNKPPLAQAQVDPRQTLAGLSISFDASASSDPDGQIVRYLWNYGDGTSSSKAQDQHAYSRPGTYSIILTVTDNGEMDATSIVTVTISSLPAWEDTSYTLADGWVLAFPQTSAEQFAEYQLLAEYLLNSEFQGGWTESMGLLPVTEEAFSQWKNTEVSGILFDISQTAHPLPGNFIMSEIGPLFNQATIEMIRKQTTYIESSNKILKALSE